MALAAPEMSLLAWLNQDLPGKGFVFASLEDPDVAAALLDVLNFAAWGGSVRADLAQLLLDVFARSGSTDSRACRLLEPEARGAVGSVSVGDLAALVLAAAVQGPRKEAVVQSILELDGESQAELQGVIMRAGNLLAPESTTAPAAADAAGALQEAHSDSL
jgi:hypothetical protein